MIFVFGSNLAGRHGKGAALFARQNHGKLKLKDTRGVEHSIVAVDVESFSQGLCPLGRPCVEIVVDGETIFADCTLDRFTSVWDTACTLDKASGDKYKARSST